MSYSFDDANKSQIVNADKLLALKVPFTFYLQTGKSEAGDAFYQKALEAGHEMANHTQRHGSGDSTDDVTQAQTFIMSKYKVTAFTMAAPNGTTDNYNTVTQKLFILNRGVSGSAMGPDDNTNMLNLPTTLPRGGAVASDLNPLADAAQKGKWQTFCIHGFVGNTGDGAYQAIDFNGFIDHITYVKAKGDVWIGTMLDVGAYFLGRKLVAKATPTAKDGGQVYTWTLPTVFPPKHYVRVTVDGGTVSQDGKALPWNEHGYYEVSLDSGSLTVSP